MVGVSAHAIAPVTDLSAWARGNGLEIVLYVLGAVLLTRFLTWLGSRITHHIDDASMSGDALVRSEQSKHRHAVAQVLTWIAIVLVYCVTVVLIIDLLGIPITGLVAPATVVGVALGFGAQRIVQTCWPVSSSSPSTSTASGTSSASPRWARPPASPARWKTFPCGSPSCGRPTVR